jgi:hypothetical protein
MDAPTRSLEQLGESANGFKEALGQDFMMGMRMAQFNKIQHN